MPNVEWSFWKGLWILNAIFTFFLIMILWLNPVHTPQAEAYGWFFIGFLGFFIVDLLILDSLPLGHTIKTITANAPSEETGARHPLQWVMPVGAVMLIAVLVGVVWGGFYFYEITFKQKLFISVPNLFSTQPFTTAITAREFDILETGWMVATVEESVWVGGLFSFLMGLIFIPVHKIIPSQRAALIAAIIIAALLNGYLVANVFHSFIYSQNLYAYANAQQHFTLSSIAAGVTGTTITGIIAHAIHNGAAKLSYVSGTYSVLPLEAYIQLGGDLNRVFPT